MQTNDQQEQRPGRRVLLQRRGWFLIAAMVVSLLVHLLSYVQLGHVRKERHTAIRQPVSQPVKIKIVQVPPKPKTKPEEPKKEPELAKILETPQEKTAAPKDPAYLGTVDHQAVKEMRAANKLQEKGKDAGAKGKPNARPDQVANKTAVDQPRPQQPQPPPEPKSNLPKIKSRTGSLSMASMDPKPRNQYEALLPTGVHDLPGQLNAGYQDYVDDKVQEGDRVDINTAEYRYIGYFTAMRKAIELVWNYPADATRRGMQGEVGLEFAINKDGRASHIKVIKSSGYQILDRAIVEAIKLASPFSPLPNGFRKDRLVVTGSFRYILSSYGSH